MQAPLTRFSDVLLRHERVVYFLLVLVALVPIWLPDRFPSQDGPIHLYITYIARRLADADGAAFREFFEYNPYLEPNELIYWLLGAFGRVLPPLTAEKLLVTFYWLGFAGAARYAVTAVDRDQAVLAFLLLPLGFGYFLHFGFYNFSFGIAGFLLLLGFALRRAERLDLVTLAAIAGGAFLLVVTHLFALAMFLIAFGTARAGIAAARASAQGSASAWRAEAGRLLGDGLKVAVACAPAFAVGASFYLRHMGSGDPPVGGSIEFNLVQLATISSAHSLTKAEFWALSPYIALVWLLAALAALRWITERDKAASLALVLPPLLLLGVYLLATVQVKHFSAQLRLLPFIFCLTFLAVARIGPPLWARRLVVPVLVIAVVASAVERGRFYQIADRAAGEFIAAGAVVPPGATLRTVYTGMRGEEFVAAGHGWRVDVLAHVPALVAIERDAISLNHDLLSPTKLGYFPVRHRLARDPYRARLPADYPLPLAWLEQSIGRRLDFVSVWPNRTPTRHHSSQASAQITRTVEEAATRFDPLPARSAAAPLMFRRPADDLPMR